MKLCSLCFLFLILLAAIVLGAAIQTTALAATTAASDESDGAKSLETILLDKDSNRSLNQLLVFLQPGTDPVAFGRANGLTYLDTLKSNPDAHIFQASSRVATTASIVSLAGSPLVKKAYENKRSNHQLCGFVPNDPYFHKETPAGWTGPGQWHLLNEYTPGLDVNVTPAWDMWLTGQGVKMAVVDDSLQKSHPDIVRNYDAVDSWDFGQADADPSPVYANDRHGVATSGVAAARGGNGIGLTGVAPWASMAGLRVDFPLQTTAMFVDATLFHSSGDNASLKIKNHSYGDPEPYAEYSAENDALTTSGEAGTIHVFSAGNNRGHICEDANKQMLQNNRESITVAALGSDGIYSYYSDFGANVFCTAPSSSSQGLFMITTTDRTGTWGYNGTADAFPDVAYTSRFSGTSSSAPLVAGVIALAKQAQPKLTTRFVKHLLARTCKVVDPTDATVESDGGWHTNAGGFKFNQNYGFGLIDAYALCREARKYEGTTSTYYAYLSPHGVGWMIPDDNADGVNQNITFDEWPAPVEDVEVSLEIIHPRRGDLECYVTSPSGTTSRTMIRSASDTAANVKWTFRSNAFWGEPIQGTWHVRVCDRYAGGGTGVWGTWESLGMRVYCGKLIEDTKAPTVELHKKASQPNPTTNTYIYYDLHFDDWVDDFDASDVIPGGTANPTSVRVTGYGRDYEIRLSGMTNRGTVTVEIPAGAAHDGAGNPNVAASTAGDPINWNLKPTNQYISPATGALSPGWKTLSSVYRDPNGAGDLFKAYLLLSPDGSIPNAAYLRYDCTTNKLYIKNDANTSWSAGHVVGSDVVLSNGQCDLSVKDTQVRISGQFVIVRWRFQLKGEFAVKKLGAYQLVQDGAFYTDGWDLMGSYN